MREPPSVYGKRYYQRHKARILERMRQRRVLLPPRPCIRCGQPAPSARHRYCGSECARRARQDAYQRRMTPEKREAKRAHDRERERRQRLAVSA
jgi:hypothetical protein